MDSYATEQHAERASRASVGVPTDLFIAGEFTGAATSDRFAVHDPATGDILAMVSDAGPDDARRAVASASIAQSEFAALPVQDRSTILRDLHSEMLACREELASLMSAEMGKSRSDCMAEVHYAAGFVEWFAGEAQRLDGHFMVSGGTRIACAYEPVGLCYAITPWNFPLAMAARKVAPALAAGCAMIVKPASATPLTMLAFARIAAKAGVPAGVLSVLPTSSSGEVTDQILDERALRKVSFTGSTTVGRGLAEKAGARLLRSSMELGGNAPFVVFEDADITAAVRGAMVAKIRNGGQACTAANRFYVHHNVFEAFTDAFTAALDDLVMGPGLADGVDLGPLINDDQARSVKEHVDEALSAGAQRRTARDPSDYESPFYPPLLLTGVDDTMRIAREEIFGPVAAVQSFTDEADVVHRANDTDYGLVAYAYTSDYSRATRMGQRLAAGMVAINAGSVSNPSAPFGGIKDSGFGKEGGFEGIKEYTNLKYINLG